MSWNAYGTIITGHAQLAFTSNADGSLTGTYTTSATYTYRQGGPSDYPDQDYSGAPQKGQTIQLVPVAPYHAKTIYNGNSPGGLLYGNTNWCQADLFKTEPGAMYCGA
jgi:hypothetical protein